MMKNDADLPYINQVLTAHRAKNLVYRPGPARRVQIVVPSKPLPRPQCAIVQTLRPCTRRSKASPDLRAAYRRAESGDTETGSEAAETEEVVETGYVGNATSGDFEHGEEERELKDEARAEEEEDRSRDRGLRIADFGAEMSEDALLGDDDGEDVVLTAEGTEKRVLCASDFEDSDDEDTLSGNVKDLELEAGTRQSPDNRKLDFPRGRQLTMIQLRIKENILREVAQKKL